MGDPNIIRSDVRLSECDWIEPVATWSRPPGKDHGPKLAALYNSPMTRIIADVAGCIDHGPIDMVRCSFTLEGTAGGVAGGCGGTVFRPLTPDQPYMIALDKSEASTAVGVTIRDVAFMTPTRDFESAGDCLRIHRAHNLAIDNVTIDRFDRGIVVDVTGHAYSLELARISLRKTRLGILVDSDQPRTSAAGLVLRHVLASGGEIGVWIRRGAFYTASIEGGIIENNTLAGVLIDGGKVALTGTYLENNRDADGNMPPALAVRGTARVSLRATSDNGRFVDTTDGAVLVDDASCLAGRLDGSHHPNVNQSRQVLPIRTAELPKGFPALKG